MDNTPQEEIMYKAYAVSQPLLEDEVERSFCGERVNIKDVAAMAKKFDWWNYTSFALMGAAGFCFGFGSRIDKHGGNSATFAGGLLVGSFYLATFSVAGICTRSKQYGSPVTEGFLYSGSPRLAVAVIAGVGGWHVAQNIYNLLYHIMVE